MMRTFREIVELWPTPDALAREIGAGVETARKWRQRDSIPPEWWSPVIRAAARLGRPLTILDFHAIVDRKGPRVARPRPNPGDAADHGTQKQERD